MPDIDASITANIGKDAVANVARIAQTMNAVNENRLFMGKQLAGRALQQSINPQTGQVDFDQFNKLIAVNPRLAPYASQALTDALNQRGQSITNVTSQTKLAQVYSDNLRQDIASTTNPDQVYEVIHRGILAGRYPQDFATSFVGGKALPDGATVGDLTAQQADTLRKQAAIANGTPAVMEAQFGTAGDVNTGGSNVGVTVNRVTGERNTLGGNAGSIEQTLPPAVAAAPRAYVDENGVPHEAPTSTFVTPTGQPKPNVPGITGAQGETNTGLAPGEVSSRAALADAAAGQAVDLMKSFEQSEPRKTVLTELLAAQGDFRSGPQAARWAGIVTEFNRVFGTNFSVDAAASQQAFGKMAEMVAAQQRAAMGSAATNAQSEAARLASPNSEYSPEANQRVTATLLGNEDYLQTKAKAWQAWRDHGGPPSSYNKFVMQFNSIYDPLYFQDQYMTGQQRAQVYKQMGPEKLKEYQAKRKQALSLDFGQ